MINNKLILTFIIIFICAPSVNIYAVQYLTNSPDPFAFGGGGNTDITYTVDIQSDITIGIYNDTGEFIKNLYASEDAAGAQVHNWDGTDKNSVEQNPGIYKAYVRKRMEMTDNLHIESNESFSNPSDLAVDQWGNVYVADYGKHQVHKISKDGTHLWVRGHLGSGTPTDSEPLFYHPRGIAVDSGGFIYVTDQGNDRIQKLDSAGNCVNWNWGNISGHPDYAVGTNELRGLDCNDTYLYIFWDNDKINGGDNIDGTEYSLSSAAENDQFTANQDRGDPAPTGFDVISDVAAPRFGAGGGASYVVATNPDETWNDIIVLDDGNGVTEVVNNVANFRGITIGTTVADSMTVFVVETTSDSIYKYRWNGSTTLTFLEVIGDTEWDGDIELNDPTGIAWDSVNGYLWVSDSKNNRIVCFNSSDGSYRLSVESEAKSIAVPQDLDLDSDGYLYVADYGNNRIHKFDINGVEQPGWPKGSSGDGTTAGQEPQMNGPCGLAIDDTGFIYITDQKNGRIIKTDSQCLVVDATWGNNFSVDPASYYLRGLYVTSQWLYVLYDDDPVTASSERCWFLRINLNDETNDAIFSNVDWGKRNNNAPAQGEPVVCDVVVRSDEVYAFITNPDMTDNTVAAGSVNSNSIHKVQISNGNYSDFADAVMEYTGIAIDEYDLIYSTNSDGTGGNVGQYKIWRYYDGNPGGLSSNAYAQMGDSAGNDGNEPFGNGFGTGTGKMGRAEHIKYDRLHKCLWVSDMENNKIIRFDITYENDTSQEYYLEDMTIETTDSPTVLAMSIYGSNNSPTNVTYNDDDEKYYLRSGTKDTVTISFSKSMDTDVLPTVTVVFEDSYETTVTFDTYITNNYVGTFSIPTGHDGEAFFRVEGAKDWSGNYLVPNPDESLIFVVDTTDPDAPTLNISSPYNVTSNPIYPYVTGSVDDANPFSVTVYTFADTNGDSIAYSQTGITVETDKTFEAVNVNLLGPAPTTNYIGAVAWDKAGNKSDTTTPLKTVNFLTGAPGTVEISDDPDSGYKIGTSNTFEIKYTAAESTFSECTITIYVPTGWTNPQTTLASAAGYIRVTDTNSAGPVNIEATSAGDTFFKVVFDTMDAGGYWIITYGDTQDNANPNAKVLISQSTLLGSNNFIVYRNKTGSEENVTSNDIMIVGEPVRVGHIDQRSSDTSVFKGEQDIHFIDYIFYNDNSSKSVKITGLVIDVEDTQNNAVVPNTVISKIYAKESSTTHVSKTSIESSGKQISLSFTTDLIITAGASKTLSIYVNILSTATSAGLRLDLNDSTSVSAYDVESPSIEYIVVATSGDAFDTMISSYCFIDTVNMSTDLYVDFMDYVPSKISYNQGLTKMMSITLANPVQQSSNVKLKKLTLGISDTDGLKMDFDVLIDRVRITSSDELSVYADKSTIPAADTFAISLNNLYIGYNDTKIINVYFGFNGSGSSSLKVNIYDSTYFEAEDYNLNTSSTVSIVPGSSNSFPDTTNGSIIKEKNVLQKIYTAFDKSQMLTGQSFTAYVYVYAYPDSSDIYIKPVATDLRFMVNNTDETGGFEVTSTSGNMVLSAGSGGTITYNCKQTGVAAGTLKVDFYPHKPALYDYNDYYYGAQSLVVSDSFSVFDTSNAITINSDSIEITVYNVGDTTLKATYHDVLMIKFKVKNNQVSPDTINSIIVHNINANTESIDSVAIYLDGGDGSFSLSDSLLDSGSFFTDTVDLNISQSMAASGGESMFFIVIDVSETVTENDTIDLEIQAGKIIFSSGIEESDAAVNSSGSAVLKVTADRISIVPREDTVSIGLNKTLTVSASDTYGNVDIDWENSITLRLDDENAPGATIESATPGTWDTGDSEATGFLTEGQVTIVIKDITNEDTVIVTPSSAYFSTHETAAIHFTQDASISANVVSAVNTYPDSTNILVLDFEISNPGVADIITDIKITSNNTYDTEITMVKLWIDYGSPGFQGTGSDSLVGNGNFVSDSVTYDTDINEGTGIRFFVTYNIDTEVIDHDILDAYIAANDVVLQTGGNLPQTSSVNSGGGNSVIKIAASTLKLTKTGGSVETGGTTQINISAVDSYGNIDKDYTINQLTITKTGAATFESVNLTSASGIPNGPVTGYLIDGEGYIIVKDLYAENVIFTASVSGISDTSTTQQWTALVYPYISLPDNYDTFNQFINISGTVTGAATGDSVNIYVNSILQGSVPVVANTTWSGTALLTGYGDSLVIEITNQSNNTGYDTIFISFFDSPTAEITYPASSDYDTKSELITIRGTTANLGSGDTILIYIDNIVNDTYILTTVNSVFNGTAFLNGYNDSLVIGIKDQFGREYYDTVNIDYTAVPDTINLISPLDKIDTYSKKPFFVWDVPSDTNNDSLYFIIQISSDNSFSNIVDSGNSFLDTTNFLWYHAGAWDSYPDMGGVIAGNDSVGFIPYIDITGDTHYWRVIAFDSYVTGGTSAIREWNPIPKISISNSIDTVSLNGQLYQDTGIIPGVTLFVKIMASNIGSDTADNLLVRFPVPDNTIYTDTYIVDNGCTVEWSTLTSPDQSYNSTDYTTSEPSPAYSTKWIRFKKNMLTINNDVRNVLKISVK